MTDLVIDKIPFDDPRLGRHVVHDPRSWDHQDKLPRRATPLRTVQHRRYDPQPEPNQQVGCCTFVSECMLGNTVGNRVKGEVLNMDLAVRGYARATEIDPFSGTFPPDDTGSSGLAAAKAAVEMGIVEEYVWYFSTDDVLLALQKHPVSFGGLWYSDMFDASYNNPVVRPTGSIVGGHQWVLSGYMASEALIAGECWWGSRFGRTGRFYISVTDFRQLMESDGDAHFSVRKMNR